MTDPHTSNDFAVGIRGHGLDRSGPDVDSHGHVRHKYYLRLTIDVACRSCSLRSRAARPTSLFWQRSCC